MHILSLSLSKRLARLQLYKSTHALTREKEREHTNVSLLLTFVEFSYDCGCAYEHRFAKARRARIAEVAAFRAYFSLLLSFSRRGPRNFA